MDPSAAKRKRIFRNKAAILDILEQSTKSNFNRKTFCEANNVALATFDNWKRKYSDNKVKSGKSTGFATMKITSVGTAESVLFAELRGIRIYQSVGAAYLKDLLA